MFTPEIYCEGRVVSEPEHAKTRRNFSWRHIALDKRGVRHLSLSPVSAVEWTPLNLVRCLPLRRIRNINGEGYPIRRTRGHNVTEAEEYGEE